MINRGSIYFVDLTPAKGREQTGRRPVLVVSSDAINRQPLVLTVVVGTDAKHVLRDYPVNVRVSATETGLPHDTVFLCFEEAALYGTSIRSEGYGCSVFYTSSRPPLSSAP